MILLGYLLFKSGQPGDNAYGPPASAPCVGSLGLVFCGPSPALVSGRHGSTADVGQTAGDLPKPQKYRFRILTVHSVIKGPKIRLF